MQCFIADQTSSNGLLQRVLEQVIAGASFTDQVTVMYTEITHSDSASARDEVGLHQCRVRCMGIMAAWVRAHQGRIVHYAGNAAAAEFENGDAARRCAMDIQEEIKACAAVIEDCRSLEFHIRLCRERVVPEKLPSVTGPVTHI